MSKPIQSKSSPCTCGHPAYSHHDELWDCVDCDCRKYVFAKEGVATINGIPLNTPEGRAEEQRRASGIDLPTERLSQDRGYSEALIQAEIRGAIDGINRYEDLLTNGTLGNWLEYAHQLIADLEKKRD